VAENWPCLRLDNGARTLFLSHFLSALALFVTLSCERPLLYWTFAESKTGLTGSRYCNATHCGK
jgi:hypothetical protein